MYAGKVESRETKKGTKYEDISQIIMINILGFNMLDVEDYISKTAIVLDKHRDYEVLTGDAEVRRLAELREKWEMDRINAISHATKVGKEQGLREGKKEGIKEGIKERNNRNSKRNVKRKNNRRNYKENNKIISRRIRRNKEKIK